jgi:hypothetical protein
MPHGARIVAHDARRGCGYNARGDPDHAWSPDRQAAASELMRKKYGAVVKPSQGSEPLTPGEQATFELIPVA